MIDGFMKKKTEKMSKNYCRFNRILNYTNNFKAMKLKNQKLNKYASTVPYCISI